MERKRQRELALASVALVMLAVAFWTMRAVGNPSAASQATGAAATASQPGGKTPSAGVNLDALEAERPEPQESNRNPFRFKTAPPPPPPPSLAAPPQPTPFQPVPTGPVQPPPPPRIPLKYIGNVDDPRGKIAILTDGRGVYQGREGEVVEGRYRILKIGVESVDLAYLDGRGRQTIRQTGQ
jgi:hypothetical protein